MKKIYKLTIMILLTSLISGCTDYRELTDMAIASSLAIDYKDNKYSVIVQVLDASNSKDEEPKVVNYESSGNTLHEAFRDIALESPKKLYAGHVKTVIVTDNIAKEGLEKIFDFILRDAEIKKSFDMFITFDDIKKVMEIVPKFEPIPAENLSESVETSSEIVAKTTLVPFDLYVSNVVKQGIDPVLPILYINMDKLLLKKEIALFKKDKYINTLNDKETLIFNLIKNKTHENLITYACDKDNYASVELLKNNTSFKVNNKNKTIDINYDLSGSLSEVNCKINLKDNKDIKNMENKLKEFLKDNTTKLIKTIKDNKTDILGLIEYVYENDYKYYKDNKNLFDKIINYKLNINYKINLIENGSINNKGDEKY